MNVIHDAGAGQAPRATVVMLPGAGDRAHDLVERGFVGAMRARGIGADAVIDYTREDFAESGVRYDVILDTGGNRPLSVLRRALTPRGTLVIVGGEGGKGRLLGGFSRGTVRAPLLSLVTRQEMKGFVAKENAADLEVLKDLIEAGKVTPLIDRSFSLGDVPEAMRYLLEGRARKGKIAITI